MTASWVESSASLCARASFTSLASMYGISSRRERGAFGGGIGGGESSLGALAKFSVEEILVDLGEVGGGGGGGVLGWESDVRVARVCFGVVTRMASVPWWSSVGVSDELFCTALAFTSLFSGGFASSPACILASELFFRESEDADKAVMLS